jgi:hypothetical protein
VTLGRTLLWHLITRFMSWMIGQQVDKALAEVAGLQRAHRPRRARFLGLAVCRFRLD